MLPSTGYFKAINCPFYENGTCERPYCHFRHSKRGKSFCCSNVQPLDFQKDDAAAVSTEATETVENHSTEQAESKPVGIVSPDSDVLQQLVTQAFQKVLADQTVDTFSCQNVVSKIVEGLKPTLNVDSSSTLDNVSVSVLEKRTDPLVCLNKHVPCVYNPTPIAELKKRHIPIISYMPTRESRVGVKRKSDEIKPWLSINSESVESQIKYKPTTILNSQSEIRDVAQSYIPTSKSDPLKDGSSNDYLFKVKEAYYPKCKKRREEYVPKKLKAPLTTINGLNGSASDQFEASFDAMDKAIACPSAYDIKQSSEASQNSCLEPKFSDDDEEEEEEDISSNHNSEDNNQEITNTNSSADNIKYINKKDTEKVSSSNKPRTHEISSVKSSKLNLENHIEEENMKQHKSKDKSERRNEKDHKSSHGRSSRSEHDSNEKSRSSSSSKNKDTSKDRNTSKSKSKSHSRHENNRESKKDKKCDKDKKEYKNHDNHREKISDKESRESRHKDKKSDKKGDRHDSERRHKNRSKISLKHEDSIRSKKEKSNERLEIYDRKSNNKIEKLHEKKNDRYTNDKFMYLMDQENDDDDDDLNTSDSDHDIQEECLKIFQEYQVPEHSKSTDSSSNVPTLQEDEKEKEKEKSENEEIGRKRVAHPSAATCVMRQTTISQPARKSMNPQQKMYERWRMMRDAVTEKSICTRNLIEATGAEGNESIKLNGNGRIRIAHVPYAKSLAIEKKKMIENAEKAAETKAVEASKTAAQTAKSGVRVAHVPQVIPQLIRPEPLQVTTQKFPLNVRQYYVNVMHDICVLIYTSSEDAAQRAVKEEYACHERCKALAVYKNSCMLAAHRLRKEADQNSFAENNVTTGPLNSSMMSHEAVLAGKTRGSWSVIKTKKAATEFRGVALYCMLKKWIMTEQQLRDNGFPRPHPDGQKGRAKVYVINSRNQSVLSKVPNERICCRCGQSYMIDKQGFASRSQNCIYHWGRKFTIRGEGKYSCCQQYGPASGCCDAKTHVWDYTDYENLRGYVKTLPRDTPAEEQGVYALDCEMCYTTQGLELTRITVIDEDCSVVYETLVKPQNAIIDYNTRFSGITEESMKDVTTTLLDVQATLLTMFSNKTILVGHSLESDMKALRLLHDTVVDTSVIFPHKNGHPQKRALKNLCSEYLRKIIQNDVGGHDSKEDALSCMELVLWKVKEEAKLQ